MKTSKDNMIHVGAEYSIQGDATCLTLYRRRIVKKTGLIQWDAIGYFDNFESLFHRLVDLDIGPLNNLQDICERINDLKTWISEATKTLPPESIFARSDGFN